MRNGRFRHIMKQSAHVRQLLHCVIGLRNIYTATIVGFILLFMYCILYFRGKKNVATFVHRKLERDFEEGEVLVKSLVQKISEKTRINGVEL